MKILKTAVASGNGILTVDTIEHEGGLWLVLDWADSPDKKMQRPHRILRIDLLPHTRLAQKMGPHDIVLNRPIPRDVLDGETSLGFTVVERPNIPPFVNPRGFH